MIEYWVIGGLIFLAVFGNHDAEAIEDPENERRRRRMLSGPYRSELVEDFEKLIDRLKPSSEYLKAVHETADKICKYLDSAQERSPDQYKFEIANWIIAGSIGKGTAISFKSPHEKKASKPDLDLIIQLENSKPPFKTKLVAFAELLKGLDEVSGIVTRKYSIEFKFWTQAVGDIKVDLLPAEVEATEAKRGLDEKQKQALADTRHVSQEENKLRSSTFAGETVNIIKSFLEDEYVLNVTLVAKYWNCMVDMSKFEYVPARSCIIELLAIYAQQTIVRGSTRDIISGFRRFLELVSQFRKLDIALISEEQSDLAVPYEKPMIRDPANSWNNLTEGIPDEVMQIWEDQAIKTLALLEDHRNNNSYVENAIDLIFEHKL